MTLILTCNRADLHSAVNYVLPSISNSVLPVLRHLEMRFDPENSLIQIHGTDLEIRMGIRLPAQIKVEGEAVQSCLIPARTFADILGMLEEEQVRMEVTDYDLLIHTNGSKTRLSLSTEDNFPPEFSLDASHSLLSLPIQDLKRALQRVLSAASVDSSRPALNAVLFDLKEKSLHLVAADGYRLAVDAVPVQRAETEERKYLLPLKTAKKLLRSLPEEDGALSIQSSREYMLLRWGEKSFWALLVQNVYPDWRQVVYTGEGDALPGEATPFPREALQMAVKRAEIFARDGQIPHLIRFVPTETGMRVSGEGVGIGKSEQDVECAIHSPFALNGLYLSQALLGMDSEFPRLHLTDGSNAVILSEENFIYVIMPLFVSEEETPVEQAEEKVAV